MQWGQIKTLFILCFLLLDIYLLSLVLSQKENEDLGFTVERQEQDGQTLESENISIKVELPKPLSNEEFVTIQQKTFKEEEMKLIKSMENQDVEVVKNSLIISLLKEAVAIPENATDESIEQLVFSSVYLGNEYTFEYWDKDRNTLVFFQTKEGRPIYYNQNGLILVYLNENNEMVAYTQSYLGAPERAKEERSLMKPLDAIMKLHSNNLLYPNDEITDIEIGYYSTFPLDSGRQVLAPTWKISIKDRRDRYVNAVDQYVVSINDNFIEDVLELSIENTKSIKDKEEFKKSMLDILTSKLTIKSE
ncbi:two-component system regulatory protein YycI [Paucisalibacillus sp. EB02]|uniref:two-component system regulatory protein YycI n=1 Tax=Paucisalibacillus sp. EB02 TaxID=1347087 RepID=UPI0004BCD964|nr:two-component system regulatory protein YycI [Paucisalibacillus sp. EB02]